MIKQQLFVCIWMLLWSEAVHANSYYVSSQSILKLFKYDYSMSEKVAKIVELSEPFKKLLDFTGLTEDVTMPLLTPPWDNPRQIYHPINQFIILHKFAWYWKKFAELVDVFTHNETSEQFWDQKLFKSSEVYRPYTCLIPILNDLSNLQVSPEDAERAAFSILRLQEVYNLKTELLQRGNIRGNLAVRHLYNDEIEAIIDAAIRFEDKCRGAKWLKFVSRSFANRLRVKFNINISKNDKEHCTNFTCANGKGCSQILNEDLRAYMKLCNGKAQPKNVKVERQFRHHHCEYISPHPVFYWAPVKVEWLYKKPQVAIVLDFANDWEIEQIWKDAPEAFRGKVIGGHGTEDVSDIRIGTLSWLRERNSQMANRLTQRISHIFGSDTSTADYWQMGSYGIGGHYSLHHDYFEEDYAETQWLYKQGYVNRFSTLMVYLTDVEVGGNTAFPRLDLSVSPKKGNALYWRNLQSDGTPITATLHGGCPVLIGNKKIANKWLYYGGQVFTHQCVDSDRTV